LIDFAVFDSFLQRRSSQPICQLGTEEMNRKEIYVKTLHAFSALTLLVEWQEGHPEKGR